MNTQTYTQRAQARPRPRIAVVTMGVKLGDETRGYTRFRVLSEMLVEGIKTNIPLHQELMLDARFVEGGTSIHYLEHKLAGRNEVNKN